MGVRNWMNHNPRITTATVGSLIVIAVALGWWSVRGAPTASSRGAAQFFFSTDDGKTWFPDQSSKLPPFQKDGKEALRAFVYKCADGKLFVACLGRYTSGARTTLAEMYAREQKVPDPLVLRQVELDGLELKVPGQSAWMKRSDASAGALMMPRCPDGSYAQAVEPP